MKRLEHSIKNSKPNTTRTIKEAILHPTDNGNGYKTVGLTMHGHRKNFYIHRLVATAFIPNPNQYNYVNHIDYNRANNNANNLEWCTQKENVNYSRERMCKPRSGTSSKTGHKYIYMRNGKYRVCVPEKAEKSFIYLKEALEYKGVLINGR